MNTHDIAPQPALDAADLAFIADELRQAGKNRAADLVLTAMAHPTQPAEPCDHSYHYFGDYPIRRCNKCKELEQQPAEPVKVLSDSEIFELAHDFSGMTFEDLDVVGFGRALLARYGRTQMPEKVPSDGAARRVQEFLDMWTSFRSNDPEVIHAFNGGDVELRVDDLRALISSSEPVSQPTNAKIREVFLANGFTIKPGHDDLKPYIYEAARELLRRYGQ